MIFPQLQPMLLQVGRRFKRTSEKHSEMRSSEISCPKRVFTTVSYTHLDVYKRQSSDWATHQLEHEVSGMFDVAHGAGLAALWGSWARYVYMENPNRFARFAVNVMGIPQDFEHPEKTALEGRCV